MAAMAGQRGFFDTDERLRWLSAAGDPLERLAAMVDFELFRAELDAALGRSDRARGGRPPYDAVMMFRVLVLQTLYTLSDVVRRGIRALTHSRCSSRIVTRRREDGP
jgi:hypothetical protein